MYFANPWGLLGLFALPVITVIHMYHRRFPPLRVAGLHLWCVESQVRTAGRRRERLPITASLLLELLAALLLSLVLSEPRIDEAGKANHLIVVLDNSASMMTTPSGEPSFREAAIRELEQRVERLRRGSIVTFIQTGRRPVMLAGPAVEWDDAKSSLDRWQPAAPRHEFQSAWDLAAQLAENSGELLFLTDRVPSPDAPLPKRMEVISVGRGQDNVAIATARWSFDSVTNQGNVYLRLKNHGRRDLGVTIVGRAENREIFRERRSMSAGQTLPLETNVPGGLGRLSIDIESFGDALDVDNHVTLIEPKVRLVTVAMELPAQTPANRLIRRVLDSLPDIQLGNADTADLIIGPAAQLPPSRKDLWWLGIGPLAASAEAKKAGKDLVGPYLLEKRNPLLNGIILGGVVWGGVQPVDLNVTPLISAGRNVLLSRLNGTLTTGYLMNVDLARSNLSESPDWPILISNLIELRRDNLPGLRRWNFRLNEDIRFRWHGESIDNSDSLGELQLVHETKTRTLARLPTVEIPPLDQPGVYQIRDGDDLFGEFAVNFHDAAESDLLPLKSGSRAPDRTLDTTEFAIDTTYSWLIMIGIALIAAVVFTDWYILKPKQLP